MPWLESRRPPKEHLFLLPLLYLSAIPLENLVWRHDELLLTWDKKIKLHTAFKNGTLQPSNHIAKWMRQTYRTLVTHFTRPLQKACLRSIYRSSSRLEDAFQRNVSNMQNRTQLGQMDYVLLVDKVIHVIIEAKASGRFGDKEEVQLLEYLMTAGVSRGVLTKGYVWTFYRLTNGDLEEDGPSIVLYPYDPNLEENITRVGRQLMKMIMEQSEMGC
ncbi:unnamed protein product [Vitrella brassicaformis CCMP3155]|uniref:Type I restriction enzyme R protein N-terminal domain-containing protein n=1 Tax=Vitrella brassicaformis (strain CCMP3155) TaxID=1169540 RepID=A0A0G4EWG5_VITBC|nr:unnamed protein product [Vitrella brassicaformis CCMP3155]|eukprot:CEM02593.1 unnamed protein product [Vitrella brassicaformis CCMP3155]